MEKLFFAEKVKSKLFWATKLLKVSAILFYNKAFMDYQKFNKNSKIQGFCRQKAFKGS